METEYLPRLNGPPLLYRRWRTDPATRAARQRKAVFLGHSQPTHSGMLEDLAVSFRAAGWETYSGDVRGHGLSTDAATPLGHLAVEDGWAHAVDDMRHFYERSFEGVAWENRLAVVPNITALMTLDLLKTWPDLAKNIVLISPPPNQAALALFGKAFAQVRIRLGHADRPDEQALHHLYAFLGAHLKDRRHPADVMSADRELIQKVVTDPLGWPVPTSAYWYNIFSGMSSSWKWPKGLQVKPGTRCLVLFGGEDAMMRDGGFLPPIERFLARIGVSDVASARVPGGRSALFLEERKLGISARVLAWAGETWQPEGTYDEIDVAELASDLIAGIAGARGDGRLKPEELVELCYNAVDDESRWTEIIYRMIYEAERSGADNEEALQSRIAELMPHWERAFNLNQQVMMSATLGVILQTVVDRLQIGVAILDKDQRLLHRNPTFDAAVRKIFHESETPADEDTFVDWSTQRLMSNRIPQRDRSARAHGEAIVVYEGAPVGYHFHPDVLKQTSVQREGPASILVLRAEDDRTGKEDSRRLLIELAYGLTGKEAEIALLVAAGKSLDAIADELDILVSTVRGHLKKSFQKMGVHSQSELASRIMSGPVGWLK
ncbi:serine aminopeptidase domain-containing protein [Amorphus orientalis]|uniref:Alpha-beta hydrolase superfamily lysophospholipase/DNA-binding CsgD family transcriptional regulator n=1 Tax=Amorphus orientalis TaxID=649198 RepID=A0AAE3VMJ3_9HYPH|nr:alpha/beta hydrolase [Amorphus orientalis]MDQ0314688.1 alpha-beta hydrolase superfamily lysophospholipase/DNA-binding CsgD family transcriptional regulator [Amorphus orientalis]